VPFEAFQIHRYARRKVDSDYVSGGAAKIDSLEVRPLADDTFAEQESGRELAVVPWCSHRDRKTSISQPNFEGFLDGKAIFLAGPRHAGGRNPDEPGTHYAGSAGQSGCLRFHEICIPGKSGKV
jgi:hypothetical protein